MATLKERPDSYSARGIMVRDFRHTHDGGYEETPHRKKKNYQKKIRKGCPGNNNGAHVYVWTAEFAWDYYWEKYFFGANRYEYYICCGCKGRKRAPYIRRKVD